MTILLTGATGFVGRALSAALLATGVPVRAAVRGNSPSPAGTQPCRIGDLDAHTDWQAALAGVDVVVHLAARVHLMHDTASDPLAEFRRVNVEGTRHLAQQAALAGVRRFIFISSIKVNGEATLPGQAFTASDTPAPVDAYGVSKAEAETALRELAAQTGMEVVIIRPTIVYGPGVKANFLSMMRILHKGIPLPLGRIDNRRSLVALDNLVDLIVHCTHHPAAANQTFLVSDGQDLSTTELLRSMAKALGKTAYLLPIPSGLLITAAAVLGKTTVAQRLCGSLQVDISHTRSQLDWTPPISVDAALQRAASAYLEGVRR